MALIPVAEAHARLIALVAPVGTEEVPLAEAAGRVLAADVVALRDQPPFDASAMDGYACRAADARPGAVLTVVGTAAAGLGHPGRGGTGRGGAHLHRRAAARGRRLDRHPGGGRGRSATA